MRRRFATLPAWSAVALLVVAASVPAGASSEAVFSTATNQYGTAGEGATVLQQGVYRTRGGIEPLVAPFVSGFLGLNGLAVDGGSIYFSVVERGQQLFNDLQPVMLEPNRAYRYDVATGSVWSLYDWGQAGIALGRVDGLDHLWDGSIVFSTETLGHILQDGWMFAIRPENVYRFDPATGKIRLFFDGQALGLQALDAVDVL